MENEKILSITIPSYNMEKYLSECLDSFVVCKNMTNLEVVVVNDGSKDDTLKIAKQYEANYPNIFKVIDKENGGHGSTINAGLSAASGKYFCVVDADDWVNTPDFTKLLELLSSSDEDLIISNYTRVYEQTGKKETVKYKLQKDKTGDINTQLYFFPNMASSIYKTSNIKNKFEILKNCFYVDTQYITETMKYLKTFKFTGLNIYFYRLNRPGQSMDPNVYFKRRDHLIRVIEALIECFNKNESDNKLSKQGVVQVIIYYYRNLVLWFKDSKIELRELIDFDNKIKENKTLYEQTGKQSGLKFVEKLRKNNFKNVNFYAKLFLLKGFLNKLFRRNK